MSIPHPALTPVQTTLTVTYSISSRGRGTTRQVARFHRTFRTTPSPMAPPIVVRMPMRSLLTVRVRDADGRPLGPQATLSVTSNSSYSEIKEFEDRGGGNHVFYVSSGADTFIEVHAARHGPVFRRLEKAEGPEEIEIRLHPAARIRGRLVAPDAVQLPSLVVDAEESWWRRSVDLGPNGRFELTEVPAGRLFVAIEYNYEDRIVRGLEVSPGDDIDLGDIRVDALPRLTGHVTDGEGRPVAALVNLWGTRGLWRIASWATSSGGHFDLPYVVIPDGWVEVRARGLGRAFFLATTALKSPLAVCLKPEARLRIVLEPDVSLTATPEWAATLSGEPVRWDPPFEAAFDPRGRPCFELRELPDGPVRFRCETEDESGRSVVGEVEVRVVAGQLHNATITLRPE